MGAPPPRPGTDAALREDQMRGAGKWETRLLTVRKCARGMGGAPADVIVADIRMPGLDGIAMVRELRRRANRTPVVMLTTFEDGELLLAAVEAGAQGFLLKGASSEELITAIERAQRSLVAGVVLILFWLLPVAALALTFSLAT